MREGSCCWLPSVFGLSLAPPSHDAAARARAPGVRLAGGAARPARRAAPPQGPRPGAAPLLLYLYIPWRAPHTPYLHLALGEGQELVLYDDTLRGFLGLGPGWGLWRVAGPGHRLGRAAVDGGQVSSGASWAGPAWRLAALRARVRWRPAARWRILALTGLAFLATVAFGLVYTIGDIVVLFIPPSWSPSCGWPSAWRRRGGWTLPELPGPAGGPAAAAGRSWRVVALSAWHGRVGRSAALDRSQDDGTRTVWRAILAEPLPEGAVLITDDRDEIMPLWYLQTVGDGTPQRPDVLGLFPLITPEYPTLGPVLDLALSTGRPVYLSKRCRAIEVKVQAQAEGDAVADPRSERRAASRPTGWMRRWAARCAWWATTGRRRRPRPGESLRVGLQWEALGPLEAPYHTYVHLLDASRRQGRAERPSAGRGVLPDDPLAGGRAAARRARPGRAGGRACRHLPAGGRDVPDGRGGRSPRWVSRSCWERCKSGRLRLSIATWSTGRRAQSRTPANRSTAQRPTRA